MTHSNRAHATSEQARMNRARAEAYDRGQASGVQAERARVCAILAHGGAHGLPALAAQCIKSGLTAEQAATIMNASPTEHQAAADIAAAWDAAFHIDQRPAAELAATTAPAVPAPAAQAATDVDAAWDAAFQAASKTNA